MTSNLLKTSPSIKEGPKDGTIVSVSQTLPENIGNLNTESIDSNLSGINEHLANKTSVLLTPVELSCILQREAEWQRKRKVQQEVIRFQQQQSEFMLQKLQAIAQHSCDELSKNLLRKSQSAIEVAQTAHDQCLTELKCFDKQIENIRQHTHRKLQMISCQAISQYHEKFRHKYQAIYNLLLTFDKQISNVQYTHELQKLVQLFDQLIHTAQTSACGPNELKCAENFYKSLCDLGVCIVDSYKNYQLKTNEKTSNELMQKEQQKAKVIEEAVKVEDSCQADDLQTIAIKPQDKHMEQFPHETQTDSPQLSSNPTTSDSVSNLYYVSAERLNFQNQINQFYLEKLEKTKILKSDESMKQFRFDSQKAINIPMNAISAVSQQHIQDKYEKLYSFLTQQVSVGRDYCLLLMCKKFVSQGETTISSNPHAAFPIASVIVTLWKQTPEFGQIFISYIFKESPLMVPYLPKQQDGQSNEEYAKQLGYRIADGQVELQDMYLKRQAGIARLYAAVMISSGSKHSEAQHPYGIDQAWRWLTNFILLPPIPEISETLIMEMLQTAGHDLCQAYGRQFVKLLIYIQQEYFPKLSTACEGGPKARLQLQLTKFLRDGQIAKPPGVLPLDFW